MAVFISILLFLLIVYIVCLNALDKWRFRADRQYPYVRELLEEWESVTLRLLSTAGIPAPEERVAGQKHPWDAAAAANRLAAACPPADPANEVFGPLWDRQGELEEELGVFQTVYNDLARSYNKALGRPVMVQLAKLLHWQPWETLEFSPGAAKADETRPDT